MIKEMPGLLIVETMMQENTTVILGDLTINPNIIRIVIVLNPSPMDTEKEVTIIVDMKDLEVIIKGQVAISRIMTVSHTIDTLVLDIITMFCMKLRT